MRFTFAAVLCPWAAGMAVFAAIVRRWDAVKPSFYGTLFGAAGVVLGTYLVASPRLGTASTALQTVWFVSTSLAALCGVGGGLGYWFNRRVPLRLSDALLLVGTGAALVSAVSAGGAQDPASVGVSRALAAMVFLGSVTATMTLGHWFLVDPDLDRRAIRRLGVIFLASIPIHVASLMLRPGMLDVFAAPGSELAGYLRAFWIADAGLTVLLGLGVLGALANRGYPAVMAATGLSYLAILTAFGVDVIARAMIGGVL